MQASESPASPSDSDLEEPQDPLETSQMSHSSQSAISDKESEEDNMDVPQMAIDGIDEDGAPILFTTNEALSSVWIRPLNMMKHERLKKLLDTNGRFKRVV